MFDKEQKSRTVLKAVVALFIMFMPAVMAVSDGNALNYTAVALAVLLVIWRRSTSGKVYTSVVQIPVVFQLLFAVVSSFWAQNREGHLNYIVLLLGIIVFSTAALDYFFISKEENIQRRLFYMITFAGVICAVGNIVYSIVSLFNEFGENSTVSVPQQSNAVGIFMLAAIWCCRYVRKDCAAKNKRILTFAIVIMAVVFGMAGSITAVVFAIAFAAIYLLNKKQESVKKSVVVTASAAAVAVCACLSVVSYGGGAAFSKVMSYALRNPFGIGGGGLASGWQMYAGELAYEASSLGTLALAASASGFIGILVCALIMAWTVFIFAKKCSTVSLFAMMLTGCLMFMPVADNFAIIMLWSGVLVYNDLYAEAARSYSVRKRFSSEKMCAYAVISVILLFLSVHSAIRYNADVLYRNGEYTEAVKAYKLASQINFTDSESCYMAAVSMRKSGDFDIENLCAELDKAKKRCKNNVSFTVERAAALYTTGKYEASAQQWEIAVNMAPFTERYKINYAKALYSVIKAQEKGSSLAKETYEKLTSLASTTENLDTKKEINDIADRAYKYTRSNQIIMQEETE